MIETIRIFRRKEDDIWALYILEFFKFIGCVVCDHIISSDYKSLEIIEDIYEVNIIFGMDDAEKDFRINERFKELKKESGDKSLFLFLYLYILLLLNLSYIHPSLNKSHKCSKQIA